MREQSGIHGPKRNNNRPGPKKLRNPDRPYQDQVHFYRTIPDRNQIFQGLSDQFRDSQTRPGRKKIGNLGRVRTKNPSLLILHPYITSGDIRRTLRNTISHFMERFMVFKLLKTVIRKFRNQRTCSGGRF